MGDEHPPVEAPAAIGWVRAILTAVGITAVGVAVLVYGGNEVLTHVHRVTRHGLVAIVTSGFFAALLALAVLLRTLQRRNVI